MLNIGDKAPDFKLPNTDKQYTTLSDLKGKNVVLLFFPFAFTGTCTAELCSVRDDMKDYEGLNAEVFAISVDTHHTLIKYKEVYGYNFQLLSDFNKEASKAYGTMYDTFSLGYHGVAKRSAFIVDKEGTIQYAEVLENASEIPHLAAIKEKLAELK